VWNWLKHAFAVAPPGSAQPSVEQATAIDAVCREIVRRELTLPAQMLLDSSAPLSFLAGQSLRLFEPFLGVLLNPESVRQFATFLEQPGALDYIANRLDELRRDDSNKPLAQDS
jgi:hypothetical protein